MTFRDLLVSRPERPQDATHIRQFVSAGLALLTAVTLPFSTRERDEFQPPPKAPKAAEVLSFSPTRSRPLLAAQVLPFNKTEWPLAARVPLSHASRNWERSNDLPRQLQITLPFRQVDWPIAETLPPATPGALQVDASALYTIVVVATKPFGSSDWPLAKLADSKIARDWVKANDLGRQLQQTLPFSAKDWPGPKTADSPASRDWEKANDLARQLQVTLPFSATDWPLPRATESPIARRWERPNDLGRQLQQVLPFSQTDWQLAKKQPPASPETSLNLVKVPAAVVSAVTLRDALVSRPASPALSVPPDSPPLNTAVLRTVVVTQAPFAFFDWTLSKTRSLTAPDTLPGSPLLQVGPTPFSQSDWPAAKRVQLLAPDAPPLSRVAQIGPTPFAQADWPLAKKTQPLASEGIQAASQAVVLPFAQMDWALPKARLAAVIDTLPLSRVTQIGATPFSQTDWPLANRQPLLAPDTPPINGAGLAPAPVNGTLAVTEEDDALACSATMSQPAPAVNPSFGGGGFGQYYSKVSRKKKKKCRVHAADLRFVVARVVSEIEVLQDRKSRFEILDEILSQPTIAEYRETCPIDEIRREILAALVREGQARAEEQDDEEAAMLLGT